jgi:hypothetical protein
VVQVDPVANIIIYIPEEDATFGGTFMANSNGLKMAPPPRPRAPQAHPPKNDPATSLQVLVESSSITPSASPSPNAFLSSCSYYILLTATQERMVQMTTNIATAAQSPPEHLLIPNSDGFLLDPRHKFKMTSRMKMAKLLSYLTH